MSRPLSGLPQAALIPDLALSPEPRRLLRRGEASIAPERAQPPAPPVESPRAETAAFPRSEPVGACEDKAAEAPPPRPPSALELTQEAYQKAYQAGLEQGRQDGMKEGLVQGHKLGVEKGLSEGRERGLREVQEQTQKDREALQGHRQVLEQLVRSLPDQLHQHLHERLAASSEDMVALCYSVICRILGEKLVKREGVIQGVRQAIEQCCGSGSASAFSGLLSIHVHPRDLETLRQDGELATWLEQHGGREIPWVADDQVKLGGCLVQSTHGSLDARLETQLRALEGILLHHPLREESPDAFALKAKADA